MTQKETIDSLLAICKKNKESIQQNASEKSQQLETLAKELEQFKGAYAYNEDMTKTLLSLLEKGSPVSSLSDLVSNPPVNKTS